jgi:hypothetical protein
MEIWEKYIIFLSPLNFYKFFIDIDTDGKNIIIITPSAFYTPASCKNKEKKLPYFFPKRSL